MEPLGIGLEASILPVLAYLSYITADNSISGIYLTTYLLLQSLFASGFHSISPVYWLAGPAWLVGINPSYAYLGIILTQQGPALFVCVCSRLRAV